MLAIVGFGMNAAAPNEPTMLMITASGVGALGSGIGAGAGIGAGSPSRVRSRPLPAPAVSGETCDGDEGIVPPLQLHIVSAQKMNKTPKTRFVRMAKAGAKRMPSLSDRQIRGDAAGMVTGGVSLYV